MSAIGRAALVLRTLADTNEALSLADLSAATGLARSTVHRIVQELETEHLVLPMTRSGGYRLGPGVLRLTTSTYAHLAAAMRPALVALAAAIDENVDLAVLSGGEVIVVDQISSSQRLQAVTEIGGIFPAHASCVGKVLLANLPDAEIRELLAPQLTRYTPNTLTDPDALLADLDLTRRSGISYDREEHDIGISAVATSVRSPMGIMQAVSIVAPTHRFEHRRDDYVAALLELRAQFADTAGVAAS